jgi:hypothetical protein
MLPHLPVCMSGTGFSTIISVLRIFYAAKTEYYKIIKVKSYFFHNPAAKQTPNAYLSIPIGQALFHPMWFLMAYFYPFAATRHKTY